MNAEGFRIAQIDQYPECVEAVVDWFVKEWGATSPEEVKQSLLESKECPPALVALSEQATIPSIPFCEGAA